ncbi:MAG: hypothetical protein COX77_02565 [Candidatus Komeilibacteria bacterium CG_4_10_14_0_2_um_filter_37_10]|uniref:Uncharacterized protein n=1 Tax=Candidatus Komeilibacteria bacterium CG_4_10_14_0_2_um_filter_37_10 TaxID=1974470 RepID=A0A2M7VEW4_9BACT|nr:MAG: hypothetical protein COX77_02565 [Candidatus Komeilibacteria bacterium CG_4_10_14_0_2_um_filter_37_10]
MPAPFGYQGIELEIRGRVYKIPLDSLPAGKKEASNGFIDQMICVAVLDTLATRFTERYYIFAHWLFQELYQREDLVQQLEQKYAHLIKATTE